jgi:murein DD-endopeptidase MepM/ murein hydrolase activator NlpD
MKRTKNLKKSFGKSNSMSRVFRTIFEKHFIRPLLGLQLAAGVLFLGPLTVSESQTELAYPGIGVSDVILQVSVEPQIQTNDKAMQNPAAEFTSISTYFQNGHAGWDLRAPLGSAIYPVADGVIKAVVHSTHGYGRRVIVAHDNGLESLYAHMGLIEVEEGQKVTKQTKLGEVGLTGFTTGPHIHFELYQHGTPVNPKYYLDLNAVPHQ